MRHRLKQIAIISFLASILLLQPSYSFAKSKHHSHHHYRHPHHSRQVAIWRRPQRYPRRVIAAPRSYISFRAGDFSFSYAGIPTYYYTVVTPTRGRVITSLPFGCQTISIRGKRYYYHRGIYYQRCPSGYIVVSAPSTRHIIFNW